MPAQLKKQLLKCTGSHGQAEGTSTAAQLVSGLVGMPVKTVEKIVKDVEASGLPLERAPASASAIDRDGEMRASAAEGSDKDVMQVLVRQALYNAVRGRPFSQFPEDILLLRHHGIAVGTAHHSEHFPPLVETAAAKFLRQVQIQNLADTSLGGLGIPSDIECICDAGTLGKWYSRTSETFLLIGIVVSTPHMSQSLFLEAVNEQCDARGPQHASRIHGVLRQVFGDSLSKRLACVCADGQLVKGGPAATHPSTDAAKHFWALIPHRKDRSIWDPFHLFDALSKPVLEEPVPKEMKLDPVFVI